MSYISGIRQVIISLERFVPFLDAGNTPTQRSTEWIEAITRQVNLSEVLIGTGSPEGVIEAEPTQLYMDDAGTAGNILYIKKTGTGNTGWILV